MSAYLSPGERQRAARQLLAVLAVSWSLLAILHVCLKRDNALLRDELATARREQAISQQAAADLWQTIRAMEQ